MNAKDTPLTSEQSDLAARNVGIAYLIAAERTRAIRILGYDAVLSASLLGLCHAAQAFDPALGFAFGTFAGKCCKTAISFDVRTALYRRNHPRNADGSFCKFHSIDAAAWFDHPARFDSGPIEVDGRDFISRQRSRDREIAAMKVDGLTNKEIGQHFGFTKQYVGSRLHEMTARLR